jgi:hypothetical protein
MLLPSAKIKCQSKLIGLDMVSVKPLSPPLNFTPFLEYTYDTRAYQISLRKDKIKKLKDKINEQHN